MSDTKTLLEIDTAQAVEVIGHRIKDLVNTHSADGVVMGLSGGIDSALLAELAVGALGSDSVYAYHLYDHISEQTSRQHAQLIADRLNIQLAICDIEPTMRSRGIYSSFIMRMTAMSGFTNRNFNQKLHQLFHAELPFISMLRRGGHNGRSGDELYNQTIGRIEAAFSARHIYRRKFLEQQAEDNNCIVLGAANRSECLVGWFVKNGVDDMPLSPINHLYKTQIRQLAEYLDLPIEIQDIVPSADMLKGVGDEHAMGISYEHMDLILYGIEKKFSDEQILELGVTIEQVNHVRLMNKLSEWKRNN